MTRTPTRRRLDGERTAHLAYTQGVQWRTLCGLYYSKGAMRSAEGCPLCAACAAKYYAPAPGEHTCL